MECFRIRFSILFLLLTVLGLCSACSSGSDNTKGADANISDVSALTGEPPDGTSNFNRLESLRSELGETKEYALAQFVAHFGPLEGAPEYTYDGSMPIFATHAVEDILSFKEELDPALLDQIARRMFPIQSSNNGEIGINQIRQTSAAAPELSALANELATEMGSRMNETLLKNIEVIRISDESEIGEAVVPKTVAFALSPNGREFLGRDNQIDPSDVGIQSTDSCLVFIIGRRSISLTQFDARPENEKKSLIAHEVMHCFQYQLQTSVRISNWVAEGTASWAGEALVGGSEFYDANHWATYEEPTYSIFAGNPYASIGFWSHVAHSLPSEESFWLALPQIFKDSTYESQANLDSIINRIGTDGYRNWPSGRAMQPAWGSQWETTGVGQHSVNVVPEPTISSELAALGTAKLFELSISNTHREQSTVLNVRTVGLGAMHWGNSGNTIEFGGQESLNFCVSDSCVCTNGEPPAMRNGRALQQAPVNENLVIAMTGNPSEPGQNQSLFPATSGSPLRTDAIFEPTFTAVSELCENSSPVATTPGPTELDSCLFGKWYADLDFMEQTIRNNGEAFQEGGLTGELSVDLMNDGTGIGVIDLVLAADAAQPAIKIVADSDFGWRANDGLYQPTSQNTSLLVSLVLPNDSTQVPLDSGSSPIRSEDVFGSTEEISDYLCNNDALIIESRREGASPVKYLRERLR